MLKITKLLDILTSKKIKIMVKLLDLILMVIIKNLLKNQEN